MGLWIVSPVNLPIIRDHFTEVDRGFCRYGKKKKGWQDRAIFVDAGNNVWFIAQNTTVIGGKPEATSWGGNGGSSRH